MAAASVEYRGMVRRGKNLREAESGAAHQVEAALTGGG
jgi:hypothetical protein